jgi:hypothetical protein
VAGKDGKDQVRSIRLAIAMGIQLGHWRIRSRVHVTVDGESLLLLSPKGEYFGLDDTAARIWRALEQGELEQLAEKLCGDHSVPIEVICSDIRAFLSDLRTVGLVCPESP